MHKKSAAAGLAVILLGLSGCGPVSETEIPVCLDEGLRPHTFTVGDLNMDGNTDLVVGCVRADGPASSGVGHVEVLLGEAGGVGSPSIIRSFERGVTSVALVDLTDDEVPELVLNISGPSERVLMVLHNDGTGSFPEETRFTTDFSLSRPALVDVDGDDDLDVAMPQVTQLFRNNGDVANPGPFARSRLQSARGLDDADLIDVNADGAFDLAALLPRSGKILLYSNAMSSPTEIFIGKSARSIVEVLAGGDLNGDGVVDLVASSRSDDGERPMLLILSREGEEWDLSAAPAALNGASQIRIGDLDGDNFQDILRVPIAQPGQDNYALRLLRGRGDGSFDEIEESGVESFPYRATLADLDGNGAAEVLYLDMGASVVRHATWR
ncbi:hypothetical protein CWI75_17280 [Kineobactrum sediminis]|uniref:VCBS repeat-containing protein n=1 Tax=Kineobactrum sediminis TaxID=1905677 RepID=A0A2N5XYG4_9GAMM|nr:VCBS repeat-containing protein [Kineobactrum sediminis]PLW81185.1 hypothetical protein CWI75_17280 [Kineobactrum sediminis]